MTAEGPSPAVKLAIVWVATIVLLVSLVYGRGALIERWVATPPTEVEETDCRIESMMAGDNPVEVERTYRSCVQAANDAYVQPRTTRITLLFSLLAVAAVGLAAGLTVRLRE